MEYVHQEFVQVEHAKLNTNQEQTFVLITVEVHPHAELRPITVQ